MSLSLISRFLAKSAISRLVHTHRRVLTDSVLTTNQSYHNLAKAGQCRDTTMKEDSEPEELPEEAAGEDESYETYEFAGGEIVQNSWPLIRGFSGLLSVPIVRYLPKYDSSMGTATDNTLLVDNLNTLEVVAMKRGPPLISPIAVFNPKDVYVVSKSVEWSPPSPPNELLDTAKYKIANELWKHGANSVRISTEEEREMRNVGPNFGQTDLPPLPDAIQEMIISAEPNPTIQEDKQIHYVHLLHEFMTAIMDGYSNDVGRKAVCAVFECVGAVCQDNLLKRRTRENITYRVHSCGGNGRGSPHNSHYALRKWIERDMFYEDQVLARCREPDMWSIRGCSDLVDECYFSWKTSDTAIVMGKMKIRGESCPVFNGLLVGEVKSGADMYGAKWKTGINKAKVQAMKGMVNQDHAAAVVISPKNAVFLSLELQNGFIKTKEKTYELGDGTERIFAEAWEELFHDLVGYIWDQYYSS